MADVFISYARSSAADAKRMSDLLEGQGYSVWFDEDLPAHRPYADVIASELDAASAVIVLWSDEAVRSHWVRSEGNRARESGRLVQARLDESQLPMPFDQIQCADLRKWSGGQTTGWQSIVSAVAALANHEAPEAIAGPGVPPAADRRRLLIAGGAVAALAAGAPFAWRAFKSPEPPSKAGLLLQKGLDALQNNDALETEDVGSTKQAVAFLKDATEADPRSATAWAALAVAYAVRKKASPVAERPGLDQRSRAAAASAQALNPKEPYAAVALLLLEPVYRRWLTTERADREALSRHKTFPFFLFILSEMLGNVGRWKEASELTDRFDRRRFLIPGADRRILVNRWCAGDLERADEASLTAAEQWPQHPGVWRTRVAYLLFGDRPAEAVALIDNEAERPPDTPPELLAALRATGDGLAGRTNAATAIEANLTYLRTKPSNALQVAQAITALGGQDIALQLLNGYYFGHGEWADLAPPGGDADRLTAPLFQPPMKSLWKTADFDRLLERIGLNAYWRRSRTVPDFRRI